MAGKNQGTRGFVKFINQLMDTLKEVRKNVDTAADDYINQIQREVDVFVSGGHGKQVAYKEMSNKLQEAITFFIEKCGEFAGLIDYENERDESTTSVQHTPQSSGTSTSAVVGSSSSQSMSVGVAMVEENLLSLKRTMEHLQEKQEYFEKTLKDISTHQENFNKEIEILTNANLRSQKKLKDRLIAVEETSHESTANVENLHTFFSVNIDARVNRLEEENKSVNASMNKFNKHISSLRSCSNDAITSTQDLSKRVESTDQHYNEMSDKLNELEIYLNLLSSQYKEQLEHVCSVNKEKIDECIGAVCQLLAKRLNPLEKLNETLNKKLNNSKKSSKVEVVESRLSELADVVQEIELKLSLPNVGFNALAPSNISRQRCVVKFSLGYTSNYRDHIDPLTGTFTAPLKGFYLISLSTSEINDNDSFCVQCRLRETAKEEVSTCMEIYSLTKIQSVTRCIDLEAGDKLYLEAVSFQGRVKMSVVINFSCYLIRG